MNNNGSYDGTEGNGSTHSFAKNSCTIAKNYNTVTKSHTIQKDSTRKDDNLDENADTSYNPYDFGKTKNPISFYGTIFHLFIISAGPTMLALPRIYLKVGNLIGFFGTFFITGLYNHCCHIFTSIEYDLCKREKVPSMTYSDTVYHSFLQGPSYLRISASYARNLTYCAIIFSWLGSNSLNLLLIGENLILALKLLFNYDTDIYTVMFYTFLPLLLLCWIPNLKYLVPISVFGNILNIFVIFTVFYHAITDPPKISKQPTNFDLLNILNFFGSLLFCESAIAALMPLKNDMKNPYKFSKKFGVLNISNFFISILYATFNILCCLKYGNTLLDNVVMNLPNDQFLSKLSILMYVIAIFAQFPLVSYVVFDVSWNVLIKDNKIKLNNLLLWEYMLRSVVVVGAYILAIAIPNIETFLTIIGTLATPLENFIFPCIIDQIKRFREQENVFKLDIMFVKNVLISCFGFIIVITGLINCVKTIF